MYESLQKKIIVAHVISKNYFLFSSLKTFFQFTESDHHMLIQKTKWLTANP